MKNIVKSLICILTAGAVITQCGCNTLNFKQEYNKGIKAYNEKRYDEAITNLNNALNYKPDSYSAMCLLGASYAYKKDYKLAEKTFLDAIKLYPQNWNAYVFLGDIKKRQKDYQTAVDYYETAASLESMGGEEKLYYKNYIKELKKEYAIHINKDPLAEQQAKEKLKDEIIKAYSKEKNKETVQSGEVLLALDSKIWKKINEQKDTKSSLIQYGLNGEDITSSLWTKLITVQYFVQNENFRTTLNDYYKFHINAIENVAKNSNKSFEKKIIKQSSSEIVYEWNFDNGKETEIARIVYTPKGIYHLHVAKKGLFSAEEKNKFIEIFQEAMLR